MYVVLLIDVCLCCLQLWWFGCYRFRFVGVSPFAGIGIVRCVCVAYATNSCEFMFGLRFGLAVVFVVLDCVWCVWWYCMWVGGLVFLLM